MKTMKKNLFYLMTVLMMAVVCVGFASCGDDDDDDSSSQTSGPLVGTWENTRTGSWGYETFTKVFRANGTGYQEYSYSDNSTGQVEKGSEHTNLTYKVTAYDVNSGKGVVEVIHESNEVFTVVFSIQQDKLIWNDMVFTRKGDAK